MGTTFAVELYGADPNLLSRAADESLSEAHRLDQMLSNYIPTSELSNVNARAGVSSVVVSREFFNLLTACQQYSRASDGTFDISVGPLMKVWGFYKDSGHLPSDDQLRSALARVGYTHIVLSPAESSIHFDKAGVELDAGGIGKGYAVDRMAAILQQWGISSALVSAGGSSIFGMGNPPGDTRGWVIHIRDPRSEQKTVADVFLKNASISTSGSYEKFFWAEGKMHSHIMDPRTGAPAEGMLSVSVLAPRTVDSEVWAKPYYILGRNWTRQHKPQQFRVFMCEDKANSGCSWVE